VTHDHDQDKTELSSVEDAVRDWESDSTCPFPFPVDIERTSDEWNDVFKAAREGCGDACSLAPWMNEWVSFHHAVNYWNLHMYVPRLVTLHRHLEAVYEAYRRERGADKKPKAPEPGKACDCAAPEYLLKPMGLLANLCHMVPPLKTFNEGRLVNDVRETDMIVRHQASLLHWRLMGLALHLRGLRQQ
jgi:hypothetical protein